MMYTVCGSPEWFMAQLYSSLELMLLVEGEVVEQKYRLIGS